MKTTAGKGLICLVAFGFNRSGIDSGELDYEIAVQRVDDLNDNQFQELLKIIDQAKDSMSRMRKNGVV